MDTKAFRTELIPEINGLNISHNQSICCMGSCFAQKIGNRLLENKFNTVVNPMGILYNPISNFTILKAALANNWEIESSAFENSIIERDHRFYSLLCHSDFSADSAADLTEMYFHQLKHVKIFLRSCDVLVLTWGSAFIYKHTECNLDVGNCHKINSKAFEKRLLTPEEILTDFDLFLNNVHKLNPKLKVLLTVSPVRHLRDGLENNSVSKSVLRYCADQIVQSHPSYAMYFPSFEIMMDDLRDYRFYSDDLLHPTAFAETYIWEKFVKASISNDSQLLLEQWSAVLKSIRHKAFNPLSNQHQLFLKSLLEKLHQFPFDCSEEINLVSSRLIG